MSLLSDIKSQVKNTVNNIGQGIENEIQEKVLGLNTRNGQDNKSLASGQGENSKNYIPQSYQQAWASNQQGEYRQNSPCCPSIPSYDYVHAVGNQQNSYNPYYDVLVLWWIAEKKKGYDITTNKFPQWFMKSYGIDFNTVASKYLYQNCLCQVDNVLRITSSGEDEIKKYDFVIYIHEHPQYCLTLSDFTKAPQLHQVQNADIVWGIFNNRQLIYTQQRMWQSLAANYAHMADLLVEEKRYDDAIPMIFAAAYIETSGMKDGNELTYIMTEYSKKGDKMIRYPNGMLQVLMLEINNYHVTVPFLEVQKNRDIGWEELRKQYMSCPQIDSLERLLPFKYFDRKESFEFFREAIEAGGKKGIFRVGDLNKRLKMNIPDPNSNKYFYASPENCVKKKFGRS